jgi:hypothetical protein
MKHSPEGPNRRLALQSGRLRSVIISRPVFTNPVHLDVKPANRKLTPNLPKNPLFGNFNGYA